jgi:beta-N-acetylhexosaminidase
MLKAIWRGPCATWVSAASCCFGRNIKSPDQLHALTTALRKAAGDRPFLIAVDQEGGKVARLGPENGFPATPSQAEVGAGTAAEARECGCGHGSHAGRHGAST